MHRAMSLEERGHGEQFMAYQNTRGGRVQLFPVQLPPMPDLENPNGKPDLLDALEFALAVEKFTYQKLLELHNVADEAGDAQMCDFVESNFLQDQVDSVKVRREKYRSPLSRSISSTKRRDHSLDAGIF